MSEDAKPTELNETDLDIVAGGDNKTPPPPAPQPTTTHTGGRFELSIGAWNVGYLKP